MFPTERSAPSGYVLFRPDCQKETPRRTRRAEDLRYSSGPRELPMAAERGQTKNPALVSEAGFRIFSFLGVTSSFEVPAPGVGLFGSAQVVSVQAFNALDALKLGLKDGRCPPRRL